MIRVGGDYQAQIPEFKPGECGERNAWEKGRWTGRGRKSAETESSEEKGGETGKRKEESVENERDDGHMTSVSEEILKNEEKGREAVVANLIKEKYVCFFL